MGKNVIELTDEEVFVLVCALEQFVDVEDREFARPVEIAYDAWNKLPPTSLTWKDVASS